MINLRPKSESASPPGLAGLFERLDAIPDGELLTAPKVAEIFGVKERTVTAWARDERLNGVLLSRSAGWRFTPADVKDFAGRHYKTHAASTA
ncbi:helix-turn-helix domain-containing protein [Frankia sp. EAN1pec]|uniref:helix-turn-helix domain-containing protein n=1 Tax=Parafrankia sp. (strain EAN1pec) TaxID=298653 RepID=UPI0018DE8000